MDLRQRVIDAYDAGRQTKEIAKTFGVSPAWARRLKQHRRERGDIIPRTGGAVQIPKVNPDQLAELVRCQPDATLAELRERLGVDCTLWTISKALHRLKLTYKKKAIHAAEQDRPDVAQKRAEWKVMQLGLDPSSLIFIDETWIKTNMTRLRGRAPRGQRLVEKVPHGHWKTTTVVAALGHQGMCCAMTLDGPVNRDSFESFVEQILCPTLKAGQIVIMDNLSSHKGERVKELIESAGAKLLYLPPYSPDLSPIEPAFSKFKQLVRSAAHRAADVLWNDLQRMLDRISPSDAVGFFQHCGYTLQRE